MASRVKLKKLTAKPKASFIFTGLGSDRNDRNNKKIVMAITRGSDLIRVGD
jgi:hypothetical protein